MSHTATTSASLCARKPSSTWSPRLPIAMQPRRMRSFAPSTRPLPSAVLTDAAVAIFVKSLRVSLLIVLRSLRQGGWWLAPGESQISNLKLPGGNYQPPTTRRHSDRIDNTFPRCAVVADERERSHHSQQRDQTGRDQDRLERVAIRNPSDQISRGNRADPGARPAHPADRSDRTGGINIRREIQHHRRERGVSQCRDREARDQPEI